MRVAALDLGSNTFLLLIAEVAEDPNYTSGPLQVKEILCDETQVVRLAQDVDKTGRFHPEALKRAELCLLNYRQIIDQYRVDEVRAVATSAARDASNKEQFFSLGDRFHIPIRVIEGSLEAALTFRGATEGGASGKAQVVIDVGGGSTEVIGQSSFGESSGAETGVKGHSFDVGSVRLTERFISKHPVPLEELQAMQSFIKEEFERGRGFLPQGPIDEVVAVAGTPTTLACLKMQRDYSEDFVHGCQLSLDEMSEWLTRLASLSIEQREALVGMPAKRADVLVAGLAILMGATKALGQSQVTVSTRGVRYGLATMREWG